ncbi:methyltransferase domain-containing protein [Candidatus Pelagibacter sp.]|nr:methyltransferase domain-containing protein [Candidatus Pelagibacter sp.]
MKINLNYSNKNLISYIKKSVIDDYYLNNQEDFRKRIVKLINPNDEVLDIGKSSRNYYKKINCKNLVTLDINKYEDYPDIVFDLCSNLQNNLFEKFDKIICLAILEHVYNPFLASENLKKMLKPGGIIFGYVPYLYKYHAPNDLKYQDYFRFSRDALSYLFKDFSEIKLFPVRGRLSTPLNLLFGNRWKNYFEKFGINILLDKLTNINTNRIQCSGYNFIIKK